MGDGCFWPIVLIRDRYANDSNRCRADCGLEDTFVHLSQNHRQVQNCAIRPIQKIETRALPERLCVIRTRICPVQTDSSIKRMDRVIEIPFLVSSKRLAPSVGEEPLIQVAVWRLVRVGEGELILVVALSSGAVRTTSALDHFDPVTRQARTFSGRVYELRCGPTEDSFQRRRIAAALKQAGLQLASDVSDDFWAFVMAATH